MARRVTKTEFEALAEFRRALRHFLRFSEEAARGAGLTPQKHQALLAVKGFPERDRISVGELADRLKVRHHSAVGLANRLAEEGLLKRERDREDRRRALLALTKKGEAILQELSAAHRDELRRIAPELAKVLKRIGN